MIALFIIPLWLLVGVVAGGLMIRWKKIPQDEEEFLPIVWVLGPAWLLVVAFFWLQWKVAGR